MAHERRQQLLKEFDELIGPQKAAFAARLPQLFQQYYAAPAQLPSAAANGTALTTQPSLKPGQQAVKRGPSDLLQQDSKRARTDGRAGVEEQLYKDIMTIIMKRLWHKKECIAFREPVDPVKLRIPDYFNYIKHPMDIGTVKAKLAGRKYKSPLEVCEDVRLVWRNCATYNQPGTIVRKQGDFLSEVWEKAWAEARIEERWQEAQLMKDPTSVVPLKSNQLSRQVASAVSQLPPGSHPPADTSVMSELDKRRLSIQLSELQGEQVTQLIRHVQGDLPTAGPDDEVEIDLDTLPASVLFKMQDFIHSLMHGRSQHVAPRKAPVEAVGMDIDHHHQLQQQPQLQQHHLHPPHEPQEPLHQQQQQHEAAPQMDAGQMQADEDSMMPASSGPTSPGATVDSHEEVRGSTADDPHSKGAFVFSHVNKSGVDESATAPHAKSSILRDRNMMRKADVPVNQAAWDVNALQPAAAAEENGDTDEVGEEDALWEQFKTKEEQKQQQAEEQRKLKEQQEEELRRKRESAEEEARRAASEAADKERALAEEEARLQQETQRARMEQCNQEVDEIKARQGTANLVQREELPTLIAQAQPSEGDLAAVGLMYKNDDDDVAFDDE